MLPADLFGPAPEGAVTIGLRPEQIAQGEGEGSLVTRVEHLGDQTRLHLSFREHDLITVTEAHTGLKSGDIVPIKPHKPFYFDADGARID
jgi:multiple sugar transport system ATP-binding protein